MFKLVFKHAEESIKNIKKICVYRKILFRAASDSTIILWKKRADLQTLKFEMMFFYFFTFVNFYLKAFPGFISSDIQLR
jgi:hypothetical protein